MSMRVRSKGEMFLDQIASALTEQMEERDSLRAENKRLKDDRTSLLAIENEALKLLGVADANGVDGLKYGELTMLQAVCNWTPNPVIPVPPVPPVDNPWDRKPGRRYVALVNLSTWNVVKGDIVEVVSRPTHYYNVRNLRTGEEGRGLALDESSWRLPLFKELKLSYQGDAPKPEGTLVTDFDSLKVGDVVSRTYPLNCSGTITRLNAGTYWHEAETQPGHYTTITRSDTESGYIRLLSSVKRKPYVKDGRWVAEVGDRFRYSAPFEGGINDVEVVAVVYGGCCPFHYTLKNLADGTVTPDWFLSETAWVPVS